MYTHTHTHSIQHRLHTHIAQQHEDRHWRVRSLEYREKTFYIERTYSTHSTTAGMKRDMARYWRAWSLEVPEGGTCAWSEYLPVFSRIMV
jgi:hypothetical protein